MNKISWRVRFRSKVFAISPLGLIFLLIQQILSIFGIRRGCTILDEQLTQTINTVFLLLALIGVVRDPTTEGLLDSPIEN